MRGKVTVCKSEHLLHRITPAYAGKRRGWYNWLHSLWDHPRLCGEKVTFPQQLISHKGSPPPMRGKVQVLGQPIVVCRITPAYAGKRQEV